MTNERQQQQQQRPPVEEPEHRYRLQLMHPLATMLANYGVPKECWDDAKEFVGTASLYSPFDERNGPWIRLLYWLVQHGFDTTQTAVGAAPNKVY